MSTPTAQTVASVHWLNWLGNEAVIEFGTVIVAGEVTSIWFDTNTGVYDFVIGGREFRATGSDSITIATPADASEALYGVPLGS
jgi:hypothetical protein